MRKSSWIISPNGDETNTSFKPPHRELYNLTIAAIKFHRIEAQQKSKQTNIKPQQYLVGGFNPSEKY